MRTRPVFSLVLQSLVLLGITACSSDSQQPPPSGSLSLALQPVATGFDFPLLLTAPAGDARLFVVEKGGRVKIVKAGAVLPTPFLDVSSLVSSGSEQGLLGLAFDPHYATNGRFFVSYTNTTGSSVVASYQVSANADVADAGSATIRLTVAQPYENHNGGNIVFGPDGFLYLGLGDGGSGGDPQGHGQNKDDLLGSLLRLDVSGASGYAVPADNPLVGISGTMPELWNWGLRNPWRFSFDRANGDLYIGDVGQDTREEIDVATATSGAGKGLNFGWNIMEGMICYGASTCNQAGLTLPVLDYTHADGCSVTGGFVYRGAAIPGLVGTYFYSDFCGGWIRSFKYAAGAATEQQEWSTLAPGGGVPSFGEDATGELYILSSNGGVYKVVAQ